MVEISNSCELCTHKDICRHREDYAEVAKAIGNKFINNTSNMIKNIPFLSEIDIVCKYYNEADGTLKINNINQR